MPRAAKRAKAFAQWEAYRSDPLAFVQDAFPWGKAGTGLADESGPRDWQRERLQEIGRYLQARSTGQATERRPTRPGKQSDEQPAKQDAGTSAIEAALRLAVASGHGIGKSALVSWIVLWALATLPMTRIVVTANTETQLRTKTWPEMAKWFELFEGREEFRLDMLSLRAIGARGKAWRCDGVPWSVTNTAAFAGLHNKGRRIVLIFDEASGIADKIWEVAEGALTDASTEMLWIVFGNPAGNTGRFRECFPGGRFSHRWSARQIDSRDVPGTNGVELARWVADWGEDSDFVRVRVKGQFPRGGSLQFIDGETVEGAMRRPAVAHLGQPLIMGVDVARYGDDRSTFHFRRGLDARTVPPQRYRGLDLVTLTGRLADQVALHRVDAVFIDEGGVGAGVVDMALKMLPRGCLVIGVNFGAAADRSWMADGMPATANKRAEMWASMRAWLRTGAIVADPDLRADLTGVQYTFNLKGEILLEPKETMKKRGLASPDDGDGLALTFAHPVGATVRGPVAVDGAGRGSPEMMRDDWEPYSS